jgi:hypothetical protein
MLPTTGFFGGCGIGLSLFGDAIVELPPASTISNNARAHHVIALSSFRDGPQGQTRNLELPGSLLRIAPE